MSNSTERQAKDFGMAQATGSSDPAHAITISVDVSTLSVETAIKLSSELFSAAAHRISESARLAALGVVA